MFDEQQRRVKHNNKHDRSHVTLKENQNLGLGIIGYDVRKPQCLFVSLFVIYMQQDSLCLCLILLHACRAKRIFF